MYLAIGAVPVKDSGVAYNISLSLQDLVMPAKTLKHITCSSIWKGESIHYAPAMLATRENFKDKVLEDFDFFLNEWMKANRP
ncbi:MAG: hypothetical protein K2Y32_06095 [Candidatus Obscuribacterales bacterium]|nr:hypothetical protein [Candidatus Obscuribacterales bacterium]